MKWIMTLLAALLLLNTCSATAENVWVEEAWEHVEVKLDCDGLLMLVDANVLTVAPDTTVQEYTTTKLSSSFTKKKADMVDWEAIGVTVPATKWISDADSYYSSNGIFNYGVYTFIELTLQYYGNQGVHPYLDTPTSILYELDQSNLGSLTWQSIIDCAENIARSLDIKLGQPRYMRRSESFLLEAQALMGTSFDRVRAHFYPSYTDEELDNIKVIEVFLPSYYKGMRLYSGEQLALPGEAFIPLTRFSLKMHHEGWVVSLSCPIFDTWSPKGEATSPLTFNEALECLRSAYANMYLPDASGIVVHEAALEYVLMAGDQTASKGFKVYPTWVFRVNIQESSETQYVGIHAITGEKLF